MKKQFISNKIKPWIDARKKHKLSHAQVQMARELGLTPKSLGKMNNNQDSSKLKLNEYIEHLYEKQFGTLLPENTLSLEAKDAQKRKMKAEKKSQGLSPAVLSKNEKITRGQ